MLVRYRRSCHAEFVRTLLSPDRWSSLRLWLVTLIVAVVSISCGGSGGAGIADSSSGTKLTTLAQQMSWQWQLQGELNTSYDVDMYDIDLFDATAAQIAELHQANRIVVCYFSAGSFEAWRTDAASFTSTTIGETLDGWEDERWLDVRDPSVRTAMIARLDLAADKGCDGVEPDNVTAKDNDSGFEITATDQLDFNRFLAQAARERGLLIGLKNDLDQIRELVDHFDFAVNEECHQYDECDAYGPFLDAGKPVFNAEYDQAFVTDPTKVCEPAAELGMSTLILSIELDDSLRIVCA